MKRSIDDVLADARARLQRLTADELDEVLHHGALLVDTRPVEQRERDGTDPRAVVIDRNVLEWRLDPRSPDRLEETSYDRKIVLFCNEGYSSSLAAATLLDLGLDATDVVGGFQAIKNRARQTG